jgi:hypothetical protein
MQAAYMAIEDREPSIPGDNVNPLREMRVDPAHPVARAEAPVLKPALVGAAVAGDGDAADEFGVAELFAQGVPAEALARHATELAEKLQARLEDLDRREAMLHGQEAELDSRIRSARLWLEERESDLDAREEAIKNDADQAVDLSASSHHAAKIADALELEERERQLTRQQAELELIQSEMAEKLNELDIQAATCQSKQEELTATRRQFEARQRELDSREAELYKHMEQLTSTEVSLQQRVENINAADEELAKRQDELRRWELKLGEQGSELEFQRAELNRIHQEVELRLNEADERERRIRFRDQEIKTALARYERLNITEQKMVELQQLAAEFDSRSTNLAAAESLLAEQHVQLGERSRELEQQELAFENHVSRQRKLLVKEKDEQTLLLARREQLLDQQEAELDQRRAALEQLQEELRAAQREVLEIRLATEETWLQLQGALAPASLSRSISQLRVRLADHFHVAAEEAVKRRRELEFVRQELAKEHGHLQGQRQDLESWLARREQDLEKRASRLVEREQELDAQERHFEFAEKAWQSQQAEYQREIQRLLGKERVRLSAAA